MFNASKQLLVGHCSQEKSSEWRVQEKEQLFIRKNRAVIG